VSVPATYLNALPAAEETMCKRPPVSSFAISTVLLLGALFSSSAFADPVGKQANETGSMGPVPKTQCGPSDRTESGLQGQTIAGARKRRLGTRI
jgi:hypothetical protein